MEMVHFIPPSQRRLAMLAAQAEAAPVLIRGGSGTGKGAIARWIHLNGPRAALPLIEADRKFPLALQFPKAQGGTFIISEVGEWPLSEQKILLGFLRTKSITVSGMTTLLNVRIIATTSAALEGRAQGGLFNPELLPALNVFRLEMPALAERFDEFEDIVTGILGEITREVHKEHLRSITPDALSALRGYDWPGNIRELRNVLRIAAVATRGDTVELSSLPEFGHDRIDFRATRDQFEKIYLLELLKTFDWEVDRTSKMARIDKDTLLAKIQKHGIELERPPTERSPSL